MFQGGTKLHWNENNFKRDIQTGYISKTYQKERLKRSRFFLSFIIHIQISTSKLDQLSIKIASRNTSKQRQFFVNIRSKKMHWNDVNFSLINIVPRKACYLMILMIIMLFFANRNCVKEGTFKRRQFFGHQSYVDKGTSKRRRFSSIEITSKKYLKMMCEFSNIFYLMYQGTVHIESAPIWPVMFVEI